MIGFHFQGNSNDWPDAVAKLPPGAPVKVIDGVQRCPEAKSVNPDVYTVVRHHVDEQNPGGDQHQIARDFFASFVDGSFRQIAWAVDAVQEWNEYFSNSQGQAERDTWINMARAFVDVWRDDYRTQADYAHIDLILAETAVGNDIPMELAALSHQYDWVVLGYHPYVPVYRGEMRPDHWRWYSGRWSFMDDNYIAGGYRVRWFFGEFGAVGHNGPGWPNSLAPNDGWKDDDVYNGNLSDYVDMMRAWMTEATKTRAWKEGRIRGGATIFTSGGGSSWRKFEVGQPDMNVIAQAVNDFMSDIPDVDPPDPPDPPTPPTDDCVGLPRVQYRREYLAVPQDATLDQWLAVCTLAFAEKNTCGFSADDAGIGALDKKKAVMYGLDQTAHVVYANWFAANYPGTVVEFRDYPAADFSLVKWPADTRRTSQLFGENIDWYKKEYNLCCGHNGVDFLTVIGSPIYATAPGVITLAGGDAAEGYGLHVRMSHDSGYETRYGHLSRVTATVGNRVAAGSLLGYSGNTGFSTGPHLHYELRRDGVAVNPWPYLQVVE